LRHLIAAAPRQLSRVKESKARLVTKRLSHPRPKRGLVIERLSPAPARPLNQVFHEWWRRLQNSSVARAEFHRALREGELVASLYQEGKELRAIGRSFWRRARLEFDREEPLIVVVMLGDVPQQGRFYVSPAPRRTRTRQRRASPPPAPVAPVRLKHAGGRSPSFKSKEQITQLQGERSRYENEHPNALKKDVDAHLQKWAEVNLGVKASLDTIRDYSTREKGKTSFS
jgi:hypothetical protein